MIRTAANDSSGRVHDEPTLSLVLTVAGRVIELDRGDSIYFDSSIPHTYRRAGDAECHAVVLTVP